MEEVWCIICSLELHSPYTLTFILISDTKVPMVISFELLEKNLCDIDQYGKGVHLDTHCQVPSHDSSITSQSYSL